MTSERSATRRFEDRLLVELKEVIAENSSQLQPTPQPARRSRGPRLVAAAGLTALGTTGVVALMLGTSTAAFSVEKQNDGLVRIEISDLRDAEELEDALAEAGIPALVDYLPEGQFCRQPRFLDQQPAAPGPEDSIIDEDVEVGGSIMEDGVETSIDGMAGPDDPATGAELDPIAVPDGATSVEIGMDSDGNSYAAFVLNPGDFADGETTLVIEAAGTLPITGLGVSQGQGEVLPCEPVTEPGAGN
ncbi:hypothetical protein [Actinoalloteichus hymeniacidonis]|uniref:Uncharacterized protein n=1 Tax=Actinoalloteichus hymeniacidonis TaxID=340345 RepID=A0AAC9MX99_9PSEU|nr:hypothetical protein [Actinoalloteichus hymeniacidonis]AOS61667.1 hypothetical protein TL08_04185 [Actinoalloteichus hymeniacidonis]MBB5910319.1 hypothetical protein [Actinoalloteichus hymeniacidonis]